MNTHKIPDIYIQRFGNLLVFNPRNQKEILEEGDWYLFKIFCFLVNFTNIQLRILKCFAIQMIRFCLPVF